MVFCESGCGSGLSESAKKIGIAECAASFRRLEGFLGGAEEGFS